MITLRHAKSLDNLKTVSYLDSGDSPLAPEGINQAHEVGGFLAWRQRMVQERIGIIVCSTARRALMSAEIIAPYVGARIITDARLGERNWGSDAGRPKDDVFTPEEIARAAVQGWDHRPNPEAESPYEVYSRTAGAVREYRQLFVEEECEGAFVKHGETIRCWVGGEQGWDRQFTLQNFRPKNAEVIEYDPLTFIPPQRLYVPA